MERAFVVTVALWMLACGAGEGGTRASLESERADEPGSTRASREAVTPPVAEPAAPSVGPEAEPVEAPSVPGVEVPRAMMTLSRLIETTDAEDGAGNVAASDRAVAIDLDASRFPTRALDPVLSVGALRFTHYRHPRIGTLRFVVSDAQLLVDGAEVAVQYGDDTASRVVVSPSLSVPAEVRR